MTDARYAAVLKVIDRMEAHANRCKGDTQRFLLHFSYLLRDALLLVGDEGDRAP